MKFLTPLEIAKLDDGFSYIKDLFVNICIKRMKVEDGLSDEDRIEVYKSIELITNCVGRQDKLVDECCQIFYTSMKMRGDFYASWDLVSDYLDEKLYSVYRKQFLGK